jgi:SAM-dependent methyltransferase
VEFYRADAHTLPFPDEHFDLVSSRCGVMFFEHTLKAFREARRVLRPQGRVAFLVWGPFHQPYFENTIGGLLNHLSKPLEDPARLSVFRFAEPGSLSAALESAGFRNVRQETRTVPWIWPGTPEELWQYFRQVSAPFQLPESKARAVDDAVHTALAQFHDGERVNLTATIVLAGAEK